MYHGLFDYDVWVVSLRQSCYISAFIMVNSFHYVPSIGVKTMKVCVWLKYMYLFSEIMFLTTVF